MASSPRRHARLALGILLVLLGLVWTLQGLGYLGGSVMTGVTFWAIVGPIVAFIGVGLVLWTARHT
jgi:hypothetical protein